MQTYVECRRHRTVLMYAVKSICLLLTVFALADTGAVQASVTPSFIAGNGSDFLSHCPERSTEETTAAAALVIGIGEYASAGDGAASSGRRVWRNLKGSVNDARAMADLLVNRFGLACDSVLVLLDADATGERIKAGFTDFLVSRAGPGTRLYVYYAGHGSQAPNPLTDERDGKDETIVPWDSAAGAPDISDKQISRYLNDLLIDHQAQVTAIFDSCHSGSISRDSRAAGIHRQLGESSIQVAMTPDERGSPESNGAIILTAAGEQQLALEITSADGRDWGAFTHALVHLLWGPAADMDLDELLISVNARLRAAGTQQQASVRSPAGTRTRTLIPGAKALAGSRAVAAVALVEAPDRIQLLGGIDAGLWPQAEVEIAGSGRWCVEATSLGPVRARARPCHGADLDPPEVGALAHLQRAGFPPVPPLLVYVPESLQEAADGKLLGDLASRLSEIPSVRVVREPDAASHYRLEASTDGNLAWRRSARTPSAFASMLPAIAASAVSSADLSAQIAQLVTAHVWQSLEPEHTSAFPMRFELRDMATGTPVNDAQPVALHGDLQLFAIPTREFTATDIALGDVQRRHVYVLGFGTETGSRVVIPTENDSPHHLPFAITDDSGSSEVLLADIRGLQPSQQVRLVILTSVRPLNRETLRAQILGGLRGGGSRTPFDELRGPDTREANRGEPVRAALWGVQYLDFSIGNQKVGAIR